MRKWFAAILLVVCCQHAQAWNKHGYVPGNGAVVLNMTNISNGPMFLNLFKQGTCSIPNPTEFTENFYPNGTLSGTEPGCSLPINPSWGTTTPMVLRFTGAAAIQVANQMTLPVISDPDNCVVSFNIVQQTSPTGSCVVTFYWKDNPGSAALMNFPLTVNSVAVNYQNFNNLSLTTQANDAANQNCADIACFDPNFLGVISSTAGIPLGGASVNPWAIRTLNLTNTTNGNQSGGGSSYPFTGYPSVNSLDYNGPLLYPNKWGGSICATTGSCAGSPSANNYIGPNSNDNPGACQDGMIYQGTVVDAAVASITPTLTADGCTANINCLPTNSGTYVLGIPIPGGGGGCGSIGANTVSTFTYSSGLGVWLWTAGGITSEFPPAVLAALCNAVHADCWVAMNHLIDNASVTAFTQAMAAELKSGLKWIAEFSNEPFLLFTTQTHYFYILGGVQQFPVVGGNTDQVLWDAYAARRYEVMNLADAAWTSAGRSMNDLLRPQVIVLGDPPTHSGNQSFQSHLLQGVDLTLDASGHYTTGTGGGCQGSCQPIVTNWSTSGVRPGDVNIDMLSYASYINGLFDHYDTCTAAEWYPLINSTTGGAVDAYANGIATSNQTLINSAFQAVTNDATNSTCNGSQFTGYIATNGTTGILTVTSVNYGTILTNNQPISGLGINASNEISGQISGTTGGVGTYTTTVSENVGSSGSQILIGEVENQQTTTYSMQQFPQYDAMLQASWPNIKEVAEYEGGFEDTGAIGLANTKGVSFLENAGLTNTPNCTPSTYTGSVALDSGSTMTWTGDALTLYDSIVFSTSGGNITAGTTYFIQNLSGSNFTISTNANGGGAISLNGSEVFPQSAVHSGVAASSICVNSEIIYLLEGYKYSSYITALYNSLWNDFMTLPTSKAPAQYNVGLGGSLNNNTAPQFEMILGSVYALPYYQTFYVIAAFSAAHPVLPYLLKRDLDPASNDNSPAFLDQAA